MTDIFNAFASLAVAVVCFILILSRKINEGIIIKSGLMMTAMGFLGAFSYYYDHDVSIAHANALAHTGLIICVFGYFLRLKRGKHRMSDWVRNG